MAFALEAGLPTLPLQHGIHAMPPEWFCSGATAAVPGRTLQSSHEIVLHLLR